MKTSHNWWITYTDGSRGSFYAKDAAAARWYFQMEGDHALDYGRMYDGYEQKKARTEAG